MRYFIDHLTHYRYSTAVRLMPHMIRLLPRSDAHQTVANCTIEIQPPPQGRSPLIDLDGNTVLKVWFAVPPVAELMIQVTSEVITHGSNPFNYVLEPWAVQLPIHYPAMMLSQIQPYLQGQYTIGLDPVAMELAQAIAHEVQGQVVPFLTTLNQRIQQSCQYTVREQGDPQAPSITWRQQMGSCRDYAVLFIEACRAVGLAARFVSGYQESDPDVLNPELHAWVEVYLPGAGWRGFDPTNGVAVGDRHVVVAAAAHPRFAAPVIGTIQSDHPAQTSMATQLQFQVAH